MLEDFDINKEPVELSLPSERGERRWVIPVLIAVVALLAAGAAVWFFLMRETPEQTAAAPRPKPAAAAAAAPGTIQPLCEMTAADAAVPALNDSDAFAKKS